jgi:hypothetical protein
VIVGRKYIFNGVYDQSDFILLRISENGDSLWSRTYGGMSYEYSADVHNIQDGGFVLSGVTFSFGVGYGDYWIKKRILWVIHYGAGPLEGGD